MKKTLFLLGLTLLYEIFIIYLVTISSINFMSILVPNQNINGYIINSVLLWLLCFPFSLLAINEDFLNIGYYFFFFIVIIQSTLIFYNTIKYIKKSIKKFYCIFIIYNFLLGFLFYCDLQKLYTPHYLLETQSSQKEILADKLKINAIKEIIHEGISTNKIEINYYDKWWIFIAENQKNSNYYLPKILLNVDDYSHNEEKYKLNIKINHMADHLNLNSDELVYRAYFWALKDKNKQELCTIDVLKRNDIYAKQFCNLFDTYANGQISFINISNGTINNYIKYGLIGNINASDKIKNYYKENNDIKNYTKWLWISAENGSIKSQTELGTLLLSKNITDQELMILNLNRIEKNIRGQFWLNRAKE